jgi:hypothetical protein
MFTVVATYVSICAGGFACWPAWVGAGVYAAASVARPAKKARFIIEDLS